MRFSHLKTGAFAICACLLFFLLSGCSSNSQANSAIRIGTMPTEDILPAWVAEQDGFFESAGLDVRIEEFDSAQALSAAIVSGDVDMAMTDVMRAVKLCESGSSVDIEWIALGEEASQGIFGVLAPADAPYSTLGELAEYSNQDDLPKNFGVGVAANTVPEYVFDSLSANAGLAADDIPTQEVASLPERYSLVLSGNLGAAALPNSLLVLGEAQGCKVLAQDGDGENISISVMVARSSFAESHEPEILEVAKTWNEAVDKINANPEAFRELLAEKSNLNEQIADAYPISSYPLAVVGDALVRPDSSLIVPQLLWMAERGYSQKLDEEALDLVYDPSTGKISLD